ncbi:17629_t:CDS:2 [Gigaspora margarita]|uniref:17629_t:CDS:1 n=1 Tax=Gigaspora margarita TaxID=4874 RepID=A0ABN7UN04_GIGMA|nr:17629_t:CDS:2 [Gigaspora margarita]
MGMGVVCPSSMVNRQTQISRVETIKKYGTKVVDGALAAMKYKEGYVLYLDNDNTSCTNVTDDSIPVMPKPYECWSPNNLNIKLIVDYTQDFKFPDMAITQIGMSRSISRALFLMQSFWSYMASQLAGKPFMNSWEFRIYIVWSLISAIIFPSTKWLTERFLSRYYNLVGRKLFFLLSSIEENKSSQETILRIRYFIEMNGLLIIGVCLVSVGLFIIDIDAITISYINNRRFYVDLLTVHVNIGTAIIWVSISLIVYPRYYMIGLHGSKALSEKSLQKMLIAVDKTVITVKRPLTYDVGHLNTSPPINLSYRFLSQPTPQSDATLLRFSPIPNDTSTFSNSKTGIEDDHSSINDLRGKQQRVQFEMFRDDLTPSTFNQHYDY